MSHSTGTPPAAVQAGAGQPAPGYLKVVRAIDSFSNITGKVFSLLTLPMVFALVFEVFSRYVFKEPTTWSFDITYMMYGSLFMLGAGYALYRKAHVRTDMIYGQLSVRKQATIDGILYITLFFPGMTLFFLKSWEVFLVSYGMNEKAMGAWAPPIWPYKGVLPLGAALIIIQGVSELIKCYHAYRRGEWL
jgi:TRAP-type mannitol/chloroaromatic compound transport system permease small subunit